MENRTWIRGWEVNQDVKKLISAKDMQIVRRHKNLKTDQSQKAESSGSYVEEMKQKFRCLSEKSIQHLGLQNRA